MAWRSIVRSVVFAFLATTAIGCRDQKQSSSDAPRQAVAATTMASGASATEKLGVTESQIVLGEPAAFSGPSVGLGVEMWRGAIVAFSAANEGGGVHGRKIKLVTADDRYDAERAAAAAVQLIEKDNVFALFGGVGTPTIVRVLPVVHKYYEENGLFYFANFTGSQPQRQPPNDKFVFNIRASYYEETKAMVDAYVAMGRKAIGTFVQDDAYGTDGRAGVELALKAHNLTLKADARYPRGQEWLTSNAEQVKILKTAGVDAIVMVGSYQACAAFVRDARSGGWSVPIHNVSFVGADQMLRVLVEEEKRIGTKLVTNLVNTQVVPHYNDTTVPLVSQYREAIDKYQPTAPSETGDNSYRPSAKYTFGSLEGYVSAKALLAVLEKAGKDLTRKTFYSSAEGMGKFDIGLGVPLEFSPSRHQALSKVWFTYATQDGWKSTDSPGSILH